MDLLMVAQPTGMWESILFWLESWVGNYAIAIILITLLIKIVLLPFDFLNKYITKKNGIKQAEMQPELTKIKERYAGNSDMVNKKTMELYKSKNYSIGGMCGIMLGYMAVTMVVFFTLLGALNNVSYYKMYTEYEAVSTAYHQEYDVAMNATDIGEYETIEAYATAKAGEKTIEVYDKAKTGFLWIKNIWRPDTSASPIMDYKTFSTNVDHLKDVEVPTEAEYNQVMDALMKSDQYSGWNGYYILCVLAALATFGSTYINTLIQKIKRKRNSTILQTAEQTNKGMNIIMPIIMGLFTLFYTASFGLYILTSSLFAMATSPIIGIFVDKIVAKNAKKELMKHKNSYDRNY
ncbi:MAG: YidC/Oxa1 family membrane protein insertase [Clostridiales bacterium]|nr:YidC/Oxa1 family membrane protein insertase [Clostridiales bacterium]